MRPYLTDPNISWVKRKIWGVLYAVADLLRRPSYAVPLLINMTGSVWFFVLIGQAGMSLMGMMGMMGYGKGSWLT